MFSLILLVVCVAGTVDVPPPPPDQEVGLLTSQGVGTNYIWLTIQSSKGYKSWQGALMVSFGPSYNKSNDRNVCQRYNRTDYPVSKKTAQTICEWNNFDKVDSIRPLDYYATWWATEIESGARNLNCSETSCSSVQSAGCDSFPYYTTLSCSCNSGRLKTTSGCEDCPFGANCHGNSTSWTCRDGYEPDRNGCDLCSYYEFSDGKKYKYCTTCPYGARTGNNRCICDYGTNKRGDRAWDYDTNTCIQCPEDAFRNETTNRCTPCPNGTHTYGSGRVEPGECLSCTPAHFSIMGKCVSKVLFYLILAVLVMVIFLVCCCCCCCCCRRNKSKPRRSSITIRHNPAIENPEGPRIETDHNRSVIQPATYALTTGQIADAERARIEMGTTESTAPPPPVFHQPAYNPAFEPQVLPWQQQPPHNTIPPVTTYHHVTPVPTHGPPSYSEIMAQGY